MRSKENNMRTIADYRTQYCKYEVIKIQNGYLIQITGISEANKNYKDCVYNATREETFSQFRFLVSLGGGNINYDIERIEW